MPKVNLHCQAQYLQSKGDTDKMADKLLAYLDAAIASAREQRADPLGLLTMFEPDSARVVGVVQTWFGDLSTAQQGTLLGNLNTLHAMLTRCRHDEPAISKGSIRLLPGANNARYGQTYFAQVRGLAWSNQKRPVFSIEVGKLHYAAPYGEKVATVFHELTHRICGTIDVVVGGVTQYGTANCQQLATSAPDDALRNADNYGYFIASCTAALAADIRPS